MRVQSPLFALNAVARTQKMLSRALERLSSGRRINSASDDAAGLAISLGLDSQVRGLMQAVRNINDATAFLQTADGSMTTQTEIVQRMRELAVEASTGTLGQNDRTFLNTEFQQLLSEFNRIAGQTNFNGTHLLDGSFATTSIQVGSGANQQISINLASTTSNSVFKNTALIGAGTFQARKTLSVGGSPWAVNSADLNGDHKQDLITVDSADNTLSVLLANGDGTFQTRVTYAVGSGPKFLITSDVNGDGKVDLVTANSDGTLSVLLGNGDGTFRAQTTYQVGGSPNSLQAVDLNRDGKIDLVCNDADDNTVSVLLGNGDGTFQSRSTVQTGRWPQLLKVADLNGDGRLDLIDADWMDRTVSIRFGNGDGTFGSRVTFALNAAATGLSVGDFDGDGKLDLAVEEMDHTLSIYTGKGDGTFNAAVTYQAGQNITTDNLIAADVNGDGKLDLLAGDSQDNTASVFLNSGDGTFQNRVTYSTGNQPVGVAAADFNGDKIADLVSVDHNDNTASLLLGTVPSHYLFDITTQANAKNMLSVLSDGLTYLSEQRSTLSAYQSRLESASNVSRVTCENIAKAKSEISDTDYAQEAAELVEAQILSRAGIAVLSQANVNSKLIIDLISSISGLR